MTHLSYNKGMDEFLNGDEDMNDNKNNENIVKPELVNLNKVPVGNENPTLNQERANIVSASIQANKAIDEKKAKEVNNTIKNGKHNKAWYTLVVLFFLGVTAVCLFGVYSLSKYLMKDTDESKTTTTTKISDLSHFLNYLKDGTKVRKYQSEHYILLLGKDNLDLNQKKNYYLLLQTGENGILNKKDGTYTISEDGVLLDGNKYTFDEKGISYQGEVLASKDSEMKYYQYQDNEKSYFLLINGTIKGEYAQFIVSSTNQTQVMSGVYTETKDSIKFLNYEFKKNNEGIIYQNYTLKMYS